MSWRRFDHWCGGGFSGGAGAGGGDYSASATIGLHAIKRRFNGFAIDDYLICLGLRQIRVAFQCENKGPGFCVPILFSLRGELVLLYAKTFTLLDTINSTVSRRSRRAAAGTIVDIVLNKVETLMPKIEFSVCSIRIHSRSYLIGRFLSHSEPCISLRFG